MIYYVGSKLKNSILKKEDQMAREDDLHKWATVDQWKAYPNLEELAIWSKEQTQNPELFFEAHLPQDVKRNGTQIQFQSPIETRTKENNQVYGDFFEAKKSKSAVVILGHWNANKTTYNRLAKIYSLSGISALRLSLPYHDERRPNTMPIASGLMSSDLNLTVESIRQAVIEARMSIKWLKQQGYTRIGVVGASLGSAIALLTSCHEPEVEAMVGYLTAASIADIVWQGSATQHLKVAFEKDFDVKTLRDVWSCVNPGSYLPRLARPHFSMHVGWARFDTICPTQQTKRMLVQLKKLNVPVESYSYSCGHNTLAISPFIQASGLRGIDFMRKKLLR